MITFEQLEQWLKELGEQANKADYIFPYGLGYANALCSVLIKMDEYKKISKRID